MLDLGINALAFVFAIGIIILVHEGGHFLAAKAFGMRVLAFSLGFGKRVWGFRRGETEYQLAALPLGGYVKLSGEEPDETASDDPRDFLNRPPWQRIVVYLAGPAMNVVLSIALIWALFVAGIDIPALQSIPSVVGEVEAGPPGEAARIRSGDRIVEVDGRGVDRWQDIAFSVMTSIVPYTSTSRHSSRRPRPTGGTKRRLDGEVTSWPDTRTSQGRPGPRGWTASGGGWRGSATGRWPRGRFVPRRRWCPSRGCGPGRGGRHGGREHGRRGDKREGGRKGEKRGRRTAGAKEGRKGGRRG